MDAQHPFADMQFTRYYFNSCPREWECSAQAWKRVKYCESYQGEHEGDFKNFKNFNVQRGRVRA